jgi:hypothetical protein
VLRRPRLRRVGRRDGDMEVDLVDAHALPTGSIPFQGRRRVPMQRTEPSTDRDGVGGSRCSQLDA